jgi:hypothetical protein
MPCRSRPSQGMIALQITGWALIVSACGGGKAAAPPPTQTVEDATVVERDTPIYTEWVATLDG